MIALHGTACGLTATGAVRFNEQTASIPGEAPVDADFGVGLRTA